MWDQPSTALNEIYQSWVLTEAALRLRILGRLGDAREIMRASVEAAVQQKNWKGAAIRAGNMSELELILGHMSAAVEFAAQAIEYADRSMDDFQRIVKRTTLASARHQAGDPAGAHALFEQADALESSLNSIPQLVSIRGHQYCDLLLSPAERSV